MNEIVKVLPNFRKFNDYINKHNATISISTQLCSKHDETAEAVAKLIAANTAMKYDFSVKQKSDLWMAMAESGAFLVSALFVISAIL